MLLVGRQVTKKDEVEQLVERQGTINDEVRCRADRKTTRYDEFEVLRIGGLGAGLGVVGRQGH